MNLNKSYLGTSSYYNVACNIVLRYDEKIAILKFFLLIYCKYLGIYLNCSDKKYMKTIYNIILYLKCNFSMYPSIGR